MRYHLDTIPLWDAMRLNSECPLCAIRRKVELTDVERFLGGSVMEPDTRIQVNDKGFCKHHHGMLFNEHNKLGHALLLHTYLCKTQEKLNAIFKNTENDIHEKNRRTLSHYIKHTDEPKQDKLARSASEIKAIYQSCIICDSIDNNMIRYARTFLHLWDTNEDFKQVFSTSKGVCVPDTALLMHWAYKEIRQANLSEFVSVLIERQQENLKRIEDEIRFFTLKFDYRYSDEPWGDSRSAIERVINKLYGWCIGDEPNPKK